MEAVEAERASGGDWGKWEKKGANVAKSKINIM